ncbi:MAG: acetoin utilization protein AcuC [Alphaproteobacteria bacterium]|jgi:acetoin utilization protein AcuC|nr:acetoin utilization protein AcuC [Alphaproteobacteria bacterium]
MDALLPTGDARPRGPLARPLFIGSEIYRHSSYGPKHPLSIPRVSTAIDLCRAMGWLDPAGYLDSPVATPDQLARFHDPAYIAAIADAERDGRLDPARKDRFNIGKLENPIFPEIFSRPATAAGAAMRAARLLTPEADGGPPGQGMVYTPASGTHHGRPDRASGFCYFNDVVLGLLTLLDRGIRRIYYVDIDAHHGDGVQDAFHDDDRVFTVSVHEGTRWPFTGPADDRAGGLARNLPMPAGFNDTEMAAVRDRVLVPLGEAFAPEVVVIQCGADAVADDPLSKLALSNRALWDVVAALRPLAPRLLVTGGGGYNPWTVGRAWAGVWATLIGADPTAPPTPAAEAVLRALTWHRAQGRNPPESWFTTIADAPRPGPIRVEVEDAIAAVLRP